MNKTKIVTIVAIFIVSASFGLIKVNAQAPGTGKASTAKKKIFVKFKNTPKTASLLSVSNNLPNGKLVGGVPNTNFAVYEVSDTKEAVSKATSDKQVAAAFEVPKLHVFKTTNDPYFNQLWALPNMKVAGSSLQTAWDTIGDVAGKTGSVKVAVIDTGIDRTHPELTGKIDAGDWVSCNDDGCAVSASGTDDFGHGTHVGGIIGAATDNSAGIAGIAWNVKLMSVKVLGDDGSGDLTWVLQGIFWAADHGAKVINMSLGGVISDPDAISVMQQVVDDAWNKGVVVVAAAGNCGYPDAKNEESCGYQENPKTYPAALNPEHMISVAALGPDNSRAPYSEYNDGTHGNWISVAAPGGSCTTSSSSWQNCILSTFPSALMTTSCSAPLGGQYCYMQGTSMAAPQVAGVAALLASVNPNLTNDQIKTLIESKTNRTVATSFTNNGAVDALASVSTNDSTPSPTPTPTGSATASPTPTAPASLPTPTTNPQAKLPKSGAIPSTGPFCPSITNCTEKIHGDADCDGSVTDADFDIWKQQYDTYVPSSQTNPNANFYCVEGDAATYYVDLSDFEVWRRKKLDSPAPSPTLTSAPAQPTATTAPGDGDDGGGEAPSPTPTVTLTPTATLTPTPGGNATIKGKVGGRPLDASGDILGVEVILYEHKADGTDQFMTSVELAASISPADANFSFLQSIYTDKKYKIKIEASGTAMSYSQFAKCDHSWHCSDSYVIVANINGEEVTPTSSFKDVYMNWELVPWEGCNGSPSEPYCECNGTTWAC